MSQNQNEEDSELEPTPDQIEAYRQRCLAAIGLGRFDRYCAGLHHSQVVTHQTQPNCIVVPALGTSMTAVECGGEIGIAVPRVHATWVDDFPFDFIAVTAREVFFVTKTFRWLNEDIETIGVSLGTMIPSELLARLCNQQHIQFYLVESLENPKGGTPIRHGTPVHIFQAQDEVPLFKTRSHFEHLERTAVIDPQADLRTHFLGG